MKRMVLAAALGLALAPAAHAAEPLNWILVTYDVNLSSPKDKVFPALIEDQLFSFVACAHEKGRVEATLLDRYPNDHYIVWCAQVPGLSQ
jgi:hypothetical protein